MTMVERSSSKKSGTGRKSTKKRSLPNSRGSVFRPTGTGLPLRSTRSVIDDQIIHGGMLTSVLYGFDQRCDKAVRENFYQLHKKGLLYRANRLVNWCVKLNTTLSNLEVSLRYHPYQDIRIIS